MSQQSRTASDEGALDLSRVKDVPTQVKSQDDRPLLVRPFADSCLHDFGFQWGGAEQVLAALVDSSRSPTVEFVAGKQELVSSKFATRETKLLFPGLKTNLQARMAVPFFSRVIPRRIPMDGRVICSSYAVARWVPTVEPRLIYCHSPMRQIWHGYDTYSGRRSPEGWALRRLAGRLRSVDLAAGQPNDLVLVPSARVADLVRKTYGVAVHGVLPPPVPRECFASSALARSMPGDYFIWVGRVVEPIKRLTALLQVFAQLPGLRLKIVGDGRSSTHLRRLAPDNVEFVGWRDPAAVRRLVAHARALILPSMEDFGLSAAEALALGVPVIATPLAGIASHLHHEINGIVAGAEVDQLTEAIRRFRRDDLAPAEEISRMAQCFSAESFAQGVEEAAGKLSWLS